MASTLEILLKAQNTITKELKQVRRDLKGVETSVQSLGRKSQVATGKVKTLGTTLKSTAASASKLRTVLLSFGGIILFARAVRSIAEFEQSMANVRAIMLTVGDSAVDAQSKFEALSAEARRLGGTTVFSATQAAEGLQFLGRAGFSAQEALDSLEGTLALAAAGGIGLAEAADIATNVLAGFGQSAEQAGRVADILAFTAASANTDITQLGEAMKFVAPIAASLGVPVEDAAAAIGVLSNAGLKASLAGTGLRKVLIKLASPTAKLKKVMDGLGVAVDQVDPSGPGGLTAAMEVLGSTTFGAVEAIELFGDRGAPAALAMSNMSSELRILTEEVTAQEGAALSMANVMTDTLIGSFKLLRSAVEETLIATGEAGFTRNLREIIDTLAGVVRTLNGTQDPLEENAEFYRQLAGAVEALRFVVISFISVKLLGFLGSVATGLVGTIRAMGATAVAAKSLTLTFRTLGKAAFAALGPLGWLIGLGLAMVDFARNDAKEANDALAETADRVNFLKKSVEDLNSVQIQFKIDQAQENLEVFRKELGVINTELKNAQSFTDLGGFSETGEEFGGEADIDALEKRKEEIEAIIKADEEGLKTLSEAQKKAAEKEKVELLRRLEATEKIKNDARQAEVGAIIAERKLKEEQDLVGLQSNLRIARQQEKEGKAILKAELDAKEISIEDYYAKLEALALKNLDAEIAIEQTKVDALETARKDSIESLASELERELATTDNIDELEALDRQFAAKLRILEAQQATEALGDKEALQDKLDQRSVIIAENSAKERTALLTKLEKDRADRLTAAAQELSDLQKRLDTELQAIITSADIKRDEINRRRDSGELSAFQADDQLNIVSEEQIILLGGLTSEFEHLNEEINDPLIIAQLENMKRLMIALGTEVPPELAKVKTAFEDSLTNAFNQILDGTATAKEAFRQMARDFLIQIAKMQAAKIAADIATGLFGFSSGGPVLAASGGHIRGAGTGTSDSIPARLSHGEYVVRAKAVKAYGVNFLEALNRMKLGSGQLQPFSITRPSRARFAEGGVVDSGVGGGKGEAPLSSLRLINIVDSEAIVGDYLNSAQGEEILFNFMRKNGSSIKQFVR